jgi:6-phosphofructokinase
VAAVDLVKEGKFDMMVSLQGTRIVSVKLEEAVAKLKTVDDALFNAVRTFFE